MNKIYSLLAMVALGATMNGQIVINKIYTGGGSSGSTYSNDFVELINLGANGSETLDGASLQYFTASGKKTQSLIKLPTITLSAGQKYFIELVQQGDTTNPLPFTADLTSTTSFRYIGGVLTENSGSSLAFATASGSVALVKTVTEIQSATDGNILDIVGYGAITSSFYEGAKAPTLSNTQYLQRKGADTNNNANDFEKESTSTLSTNETLNNGANDKLIRNTFVTNELQFSVNSDVKIFNANGQVVVSAKVTENTPLFIGNLASGVYFVTGVVNGKSVSAKFVKK